MGKRIGTLLEKNVEKIFRLAGFNTLRNTRLDGYEVDILAQWNQTKIIIQCKQYERSRLNLQDVIHEWNSKNQIIKSDKVVIVVFGQEVEQWQIELANQFNITLLGETEMDLVDNLVIEKGKNSLGEILGMLDLKQPLEEAPIISKGKNINQFGIIFMLIFAIISSVIFPPLIIFYLIILIIWIIIKSKKKK